MHLELILEMLYREIFDQNWGKFVLLSLHKRRQYMEWSFYEATLILILNLIILSEKQDLQFDLWEAAVEAGGRSQPWGHGMAFYKRKQTSSIEILKFCDHVL